MIILQAVAKSASSMSDLKKSDSAIPSPRAESSASPLDSAKVCCVREIAQMVDPSTLQSTPEVLFLVAVHPAQSESAKQVTLREVFFLSSSSLGRSSTL